MSKKDILFSLMLGVLIGATIAMLGTAIITQSVLAGVCTVFNAVALILFAIWMKKE